MVGKIGQGEGTYLKQKLVPFGEYVPLQDLLRGLIAFFDLPMSDFARGPADQPLLQAKGYQIAAYICYEVVYPEFAAGLAAQSNLLLTVSNDAWFGKSIGPLQHLQMAQMRALEAGADSYLCKPASREMLHAKLGVILRLRAMQRQAEERNRELGRYRSMQEEEQRLARFVMERLINREALNDPVVAHFIAPAAEFSGDLIAAARTPAARLFTRSIAAWAARGPGLPSGPSAMA